ncbi:MAG: LysR family transcriptional regulator [Minicystis sp.]
MELSWLEALVITVEHGSFQTAAHKLGVSRATLRGRVEALERHVGLPLLVRTVQGVELTDAGESFLVRARSLLVEAAALARFSDEREANVTGELCIRVPVGIPAMLHVLALTYLRQRYSGVRIRFEVHADPTADLGPETDFVLHFCPRVARGDLHTVRVASFPVRLIASAAYLAERGAPRGPES